MTIRDYLALFALATAYLLASGTDVRPVPASSHQTATWYCSETSPCTRGYGPSDLVAAIDPTTGIERGERVTVRHGDRSVTVRIVDVCACAGARVIDLSRIAFSRLADPSRGVIPVSLSVGGPRFTLPPTDTAP